MIRSLQQIKSSQALFLLIGMALVSLVVAPLVSLELMRAQEVETWKRQLDNLSLVMAEESEQALSSAYLVLDGIVAQVRQRQGVGDAAAWRRSMRSREMHDMLRSRINDQPHIDVATIVAANGDVVNFSRSHPAPAINLRERDYFQVHLKGAGPRDFISAPVQNKANGKWTFYLSRPLTGSAGQFIGLVLVGISVEAITSFYAKIGTNLGPDATLNLYRRDFTRMTRWPPADASIGKQFLNSSVHASVEIRKKTSDVLYTEARRTTVESADPRLVATRVLDRYPLIVSISVTDKIFLANWRDARLVILALAATSIAALLAASIYLRRVLRQRETEMEMNLQLRIKAEAANIAKNQFLASMSHELRTPLNAVLGFSELLEMDPGLSREHQDNAKEINNAGQHLLALVNDLIDLSRIESDNLELTPKPVAANSFTAECFSMLKMKAQDAGVQLIDEGGDAKDAMIRVDPIRFRQILLNLLSNAVKYNRRGGSVRLTCAFHQGKVRLCVRDTGHGLSADKQARLFTAFDRLGQESRKIEGTGIGLVISKRLTQAMGGSLGLESAVGVGSTFWVEFPPCPA